MRFFLIGITRFQSTLVVKLTSFLQVQNIKISFFVSSFLGTRPFLVPRLTSLAGKVLSALLYLFLLSTAMRSAMLNTASELCFHFYYAVRHAAATIALHFHYWLFLLTARHICKQFVHNFCTAFHWQLYCFTCKILALAGLRAFLGIFLKKNYHYVLQNLNK